MKKQLLLVMAFVAATFTVNAQTYAVQESDVITSETEITSVDGVKLTFGNDTYAMKTSSDIDGGALYVAYASGKANPVDGAGLAFDKAGAEVPTIGTLYNLAVTKDGTMEIAVVLNANKKFYVLEDGVAMEGYDGITVVDKYYGTYSFPVKAGKTYTTFCTGSKLGFFGFTFTPEGGATGITDSAVNKEVVATEYYNVVGMRLNEPAQGLNIIKRIMSDGSVETTKACIE